MAKRKREKRKRKMPGKRRPLGNAHVLASGEPAPTPTLVALARAKAMDEGILPHEWLLKVARGEGIPQKVWEEVEDDEGNVVSKRLVEVVIYPNIDARVDAAKAAAPYYAPRLVAQTVGIVGSVDVSRLTDAELDARVKLLTQKLDLG